MNSPRPDSTARDLLPLIIALALPLFICLVVLVSEPGLERSFLFASIKVGVILVALGLAISFVAHRLAGRTDRG